MKKYYQNEGKRYKYIKKVLEEDIGRLGCKVWGLELFGRRSNQTLRIYIDKNEGISVEDCEMVSKHVSKVLDTVNGFSENYILEVSSPGLNRHFFFCEQYQDYLGQIVDVRSKEMIAGQGHFRGTLLKVTEQSIYLQMEDQADPILIEFENIKKAKLIAEIVWNKK